MRKIMDFLEGVYLAVKVWFQTTQWFRVVKITIATSVTALLIFFVAGTLFVEEGAFTISFVKNNKKEDALISLSETPDFANPTVMLDANGEVDMTNISGSWLPNDIESENGSHNGDDYIAYTFYAKNVGAKACTLKGEFNIDSSVKSAEAAIRIRLYKNGKATTYAQMGADGLPEYGTTPFESAKVAFSDKTENFEKDEIIKYTLVIWLEGDDPECLDNIKGGNVKMSMTFKVEETPDT
ncbi:MAG: hypothetical protein E7642_01935 [Ruminococcaceae bacterium]|nr:hypothetical protein [Oscillospiraceae bacterium]